MTRRELEVTCIHEEGNLFGILWYEPDLSKPEFYKRECFCGPLMINLAGEDVYFPPITDNRGLGGVLSKMENEFEVLCYNKIRHSGRNIWNRLL